MPKPNQRGQTEGQSSPGDASLPAELPTLVVPSAPVTLHLSMPAPDQLVTAATDRDLRLVEQGVDNLLLPVQLLPAMDAKGLPAKGKWQLVAAIPPCKAAPEKRLFSLMGKPKNNFKISNTLLIKDASETTLVVWEDTSPVLSYHYGVITSKEVPEKDPRRTRACYVHPVWGLHGEVLTGDFPRDHYHHHGIFWAWPHVRIADKQYDLWLGKNICQRFQRCLCRQEGPVAVTLAFENAWQVGQKQVALERVWIRTYPATEGARAIDLSLTWIPIDRPITLWGAEGKSYGGLSMRFAKRRDTVITVPEGRTQEDLKETRLAWADLTAQFQGAPAPSGATVMVPPNHPDYPPTWLTRHYGVLCVGYPGVRPITFPPGQPWRLEYRVWVHEHAAPLATLQKAYAGYVATGQARWEP